MPHDATKVAYFDRVIASCKETIAANAAGNVVRIYDLYEDKATWVFGHQHWDALGEDGDPMRGRSSATLAEWHDYLKSYYWPRSKAAMQARPGLVSQTKDRTST